MDFTSALEQLKHGELKAGLTALDRAMPLDPAQAEQVADVLDRHAELLVARPDVAARAAWLLAESRCARVPRFVLLGSEATYEPERVAWMFDRPLPDNSLMNARRQLEGLLLVEAFETARRAGPPVAVWASLVPPGEVGDDDATHMAAQVLRRFEALAADLYAWTIAQPGAPSWFLEAAARAACMSRDEARRRVELLVDRQRWDELVARGPELAARYPDETTFPLRIALAHWHRGERDAAIAACEDALARHPTSAALLGQLVGFLVLAAQPTRALAAWRGSRERIDRTGQTENLGKLLENVLAAFAATGRPAEGLAELEQEIETCGTDVPLFNAACVAALARDMPRVLGYTERLLAKGRARQDFLEERDFDGIRHLPAFRELMERDFTGSRAIRIELESDDPDRIRRGLHALRAWVDARGREADLSLFTLERKKGDGKLLANSLFDGILARHGRSLGRAALLDLAASIHGEARAYQQQRALRTALLLLCETLDHQLERDIADIFLRGYTYDDHHRAFDDTALDCFLDEVFPRFSGPVLADLIIRLYDKRNYLDVQVLLPLALARGPSPQQEQALVDRVIDALLPDADSLAGDPFIREQMDTIEACVATREISGPTRARLSELLAVLRG